MGVERNAERRSAMSARSSRTRPSLRLRLVPLTHMLWR